MNDFEQTLLRILKENSNWTISIYCSPKPLSILHLSFRCKDKKLTRSTSLFMISQSIAPVMKITLEEMEIEFKKEL